MPVPVDVPGRPNCSNKPASARAKVVSETADDAAALKRLAVDEDGGDGDHRRMAESGEGLAHINAGNGNCMQRQHGDDVILPISPK